MARGLPDKIICSITKKPKHYVEVIITKKAFVLEVRFESFMM